MADMADMALEDLRQRIDEIDDELVRLFVERIGIAEQVAEEKRAAGLPIRNDAREREILSRLTAGKDDYMVSYIRTLYSSIFDLSRSHQAVCGEVHSTIAEEISNALEHTLKVFPKSAAVACQGIEGANSTYAVERMFSNPMIMYFNAFEGVFSAVDKGLCQYGMLPIENSLHGSVTHVYELLERYKLYIVNSVKLKINHTLLAVSGAELSDIKAVYSHEQALAQCSDFLRELGIEPRACENTAIAARMVAESGDKSIAAISSMSCAELYNLSVLSEHVQNNANNYTRFICISKKLEIYPGANRISLMITLPHKPGSLYHIMSKFAALGINLTKLESRPLPDRDFEFVFYFDLDVSVYDDAVLRLFTQLECGSERFVFLGCYSEI